MVRRSRLDASFRGNDLSRPLYSESHVCLRSGLVLKRLLILLHGGKNIFELVIK